MLALNLNTNKIHDTCNNAWLRAKQHNIAFKEAPFRENESSLKQNTFTVEQDCWTLHVAQNLTF